MSTHLHNLQDSYLKMQITQQRANYIYEFNQIDLVPIIWHAFTMQNKGTSKITNCILKTIQHGHSEIEENWSNIRRIKTTVRKINSIRGKKKEQSKSWLRQDYLAWKSMQ